MASFKMNKASEWGKSDWLFALCLFLLVLTSFYIWSHKGLKGKEYAELNKAQLEMLDKLVDYYKLDTPAINKIKRDTVIIRYLKSEFKSSLGDCEDSLRPFMDSLSNADLRSYLHAKKFQIKSYFWLQGPNTYMEVLLWSLAGVFTSLIFYVSSANKKINGVANKEDDDIGPFKATEISGQVAKFFYAPVITLVLVIGYDLINSDSSLINIGVGKGIIIFSFISGFYSGRMMKLLDKLKDVVFPDNSKPNAQITTISVKLSTAETYKDIDTDELMKAIVSLHPTSGNINDIAFEPDADTKTFKAFNVPYGSYLLSASCTYTKDGEITTLESPKQPPVKINAGTQTPFDLILDKQNPVPIPSVTDPTKPTIPNLNEPDAIDPTKLIDPNTTVPPGTSKPIDTSPSISDNQDIITRDPKNYN